MMKIFLWLFQFQDIFPVISNSLYDFGKAYFCTLCSLVPFLERNDLETLPYFVAATLISLPVSLHEDVLDVLCWHLLPFTMNTLPQQNTENCPATGTEITIISLIKAMGKISGQASLG